MTLADSSASPAGASTPTHSENSRGAALMMLAMFAFTANDSVIKYASDDLALFQMVFMRGALLTAFLATLLRFRGVRLTPGLFASKPLRLRVALETVGTVTFLLTLINIAISVIAAIVQLVPIAVTFAAARVLRERVDPVRVGALVVGSAGVVLVIRPWTSDFSPWMLVGVFTVGIVVARELATRRIPPEVPSIAVAFATSLSVTIMGGFVSIFQGWKPINGTHIGLLVLAAAFLCVAYISSVATIRVGDVSFAALFRYSGLVFAIVAQLVVFGDVPHWLTFVGSGVIAAAGVVSLRHAQRPPGIAAR